MLRGDTAALLRQMLLAVLVLGMAALMVELFLLEHTESRTQFVPIVALGAGILAAAAAGVRARRATLLTLRVVMVGFIVAGLVGMALHYQGNVEFELERTPQLRGLGLFRNALAGATPALAPGVLVQFGLLGLIYTWRHPRLARSEAQGSTVRT